MDDIIERVREYAKNLTNNGAPHQTGIGRDILQVVSAAASHLASAAVTDTAVITAASGAKALQDELADVRGQLADALVEKSRLADAVAEAAAENARLRAALDATTVNTAKGDEQSKDLAEPDASQKQKRKKG